MEDWYHGLDIAPSRWPSFERRLDVALDYLLDELARHATCATFFVLGIVAAERPESVRRIAAAGHEIGTHGWCHTPIYRQRRDEFRGELRRSLDVLQELIGRRVRGHRAAMFSITSRSWWALEELAAAGLCYDSSIFPVHNYRYGVPNANRFPHPCCTDNFSRPPGEATSVAATNDLWEFPISTLRVGGVNLPIGGGFYARGWPYAVLRRTIEQLNAQGQPAVFYFHPWEFDPWHPRIRHESYWLARATHYYRLPSTRATLRGLLKEFQWTTMSESLPC